MFHRAVVRALVCSLPVLLAAWGRTADAGFAVDGSLQDWGVVTNDSMFPSSWTIGTNSSGTMSGMGFSFRFVREDSSDTAGDSGFVGPNHGGQNYDGEFLAIGVNGDNIVIAIVTGQRPDNGLARYSPGDLRIGTSQGIIGVEVGGGQGGLSSSGSVQEEGVAGDGSGSTYTLNTSSGLTTGHTASPSSGSGSDHTAGAVFWTEESNWILDPIAGGTGDPIWPTPGNDPVQLQFTGGTFIGLADYIYTRNSLYTSSTNHQNQHAVIELSIPMAYFSGATIESIQWAPSCGNDMLYLETTIYTPEPSTFVLGFLGIVGAAGLRRSRRQAA